MFELRRRRLLPVHAFIRRLLRSLLVGISVIAFSLIMGMIGYHHYENMNWVDAFVNASMILTGMGPVSTLHTDAGKIFAGCYALFSGIIFLVVIVIIAAPIFHRLLHKFLITDTLPNDRTR